jgi:hypothetical protein
MSFFAAIEGSTALALPTKTAVRRRYQSRETLTSERLN